MYSASYDDNGRFIVSATSTHTALHTPLNVFMVYTSLNACDRIATTFWRVAVRSNARAHTDTSSATYRNIDNAHVHLPQQLQLVVNRLQCGGELECDNVADGVEEQLVERQARMRCLVRLLLTSRHHAGLLLRLRRSTSVHRHRRRACCETRQRRRCRVHCTACRRARA
jgi:hypothetical protein